MYVRKASGYSEYVVILVHYMTYDIEYCIIYRYKICISHRYLIVVGLLCEMPLFDT